MTHDGNMRWIHCGVGMRKVRIMKKIFVCLLTALGLTTACGQQHFENVDVQGFSELYPTAQADTYGRYTAVVSDNVSYDAKVRPVISPDNSYDTMRTFILSANERVFSEQLDVDYDWTIGDDNPISWMRTVSDKVDCRLLVDDFNSSKFFSVKYSFLLWFLLLK